MRVILLCVCCFVSIYCTAQVRDVRSNVEKDKAEKRSAYSGEFREYESTSYSPPEIADGLGEFIVGGLFYITAYGIYRGLDYGQYLMQRRRVKHPETFSLQGDLVSGFDFKRNAGMVTSSVRGNWGLFASDMRFISTHDVTGSMNAIDWQVVKLRLPIKNIKLDYGIGFSYFLSPSKIYFDRSAGFDWCFINRRATLQGEFRWSQDTNLGRYRKESGISLDYETGLVGRFGFCPSIGFVYQDYFGTTQFRFVQLGMKVRLF